METRTRILHAAFEVITRNSYAGAGIAEIISMSGMTRGAVYHHFASKQEIGQAVVGEVILARYRRYWEQALAPESYSKSNSILDALIAGLKNTKLLNCNNGCSLANFYQSVNAETEPQLAETIRQAQREFEGIFIAAVERAIEDGVLDPATVNPRTLGPFIAAAFQGAMNAGGVAGGSTKYLKLIAELESYLRSLGNAAPRRTGSGKKTKKAARV